jgi:hypothetical protein
MGNEGPKVFGVMVPKTGTHLLDSILARMPGLRRLERAGFTYNLKYHPLNFLPGAQCRAGIGRTTKVKLHAVRWAIRRIRPGQYALGNMPYDTSVMESLVRSDVRVIVLIRDPRAVCVSAMHMIMRNERHFAHRTLRDCSDDKSRLNRLLSGITNGPKGRRRQSLTDSMRDILGWVRDPRVLTVRFEDAVGPQGGGDLDSQTIAIGRIATHLGLELGSADARAIGKEMFGKGRTFRSGQIDGWRRYFDQDLALRFDRELGSLLPELGFAATSEVLSRDRPGEW